MDRDEFGRTAEDRERHERQVADQEAAIEEYEKAIAAWQKKNPGKPYPG